MGAHVHLSSSQAIPCVTSEGERARGGTPKVLRGGNRTYVEPTSLPTGELGIAARCDVACAGRAARRSGGNMRAPWG